MIDAIGHCAGEDACRTAQIHGQDEGATLVIKAQSSSSDSTFLERNVGGPSASDNYPLRTKPTITCPPHCDYYPTRDSAFYRVLSRYARLKVLDVTSSVRRLCCIRVDLFNR